MITLWLDRLQSLYISKIPDLGLQPYTVNADDGYIVKISSQADPALCPGGITQAPDNVNKTDGHRCQTPPSQCLKNVQMHILLFERPFHMLVTCS